ncbi:MAG TPA: methylmalonyl Co-A mutase-associated GTPase MeaB [Thermomicrobiales bacterium]|nr:methylmalonyl Co-A mutase-associated GTPase MeaB [Thermomicrobiales bacterium]
MDLVDRALAGEARALARLATHVEDHDTTGRTAIERLYSLTGNAHVVGVTGSPGVGKSTLANKLVAEFRRDQRRVAVIAIDPSSPLSGGATLGDRIRMLDQYADDQVFVRSVAARGHHGGLSATTGDLIHLFDATGYDPILVETVGVGQGEVEISKLAHTSLVLQSPGTGDDIQAIKAGILEIADIFVVTKSDFPGAQQLQHVLTTMLEQGRETRPVDTAWSPPVVLVDASRGEGVERLVERITAHREHLLRGDGWAERNRRRAWTEIQAALHRAVEEASSEEPSHVAKQALRAVMDRAITPRAAATQVLRDADFG